MAKQRQTKKEAGKIDQQKLNEFLGRFVGDLGAALHASTVLVGEKLGLYKAMAGAGELTSQQLAAMTSTNERYVREWLAAQAASGYVTFDHLTGKYYLTPEQVFTLADDTSPAYLPGAFYVAASVFKDEPKLVQAFKSGEGVGWHQHHADLFKGTEMFFRPNYAGNLVPSWIPALDGVVAKLERGASVADVGCGHGSSTIIMANAYPNSSFVGYDYHAPSIKAAKKRATEAGLGGRVKFEVASAASYPAKSLDLVTVFDALHDMGDPAGVSAHVFRSLKPNGTWMIVEPFANETVAGNLNPVGRVFYSASTMICTGASKAQKVGLALGAQASDAKLREVVLRGGFTRFRRATQTPFNRVFEAKP